MKPLRLDWRSNYAAGGGTYGFHVHDHKLREACEKLGARIDPAADITVFIGPPEDFRPVAGKFNVLFTAWEHVTVPARLAAPARNADLIVVPSAFLKPVFTKATGKPVAVVHLGVDSPPFDPLKLNRAKRRRRSGAVFTWLWCGQTHRRKGWDLLTEIWKGYTWIGMRRGDAFPQSCLHIKTTLNSTEPGTFERVPGHGFYPVFLDTRNLARPDYWRMMQRADAYLFSSRGEGFGLTLAEALASGLPAVYPPTTAMPDYAVGFPCETEESWTESPRWGRMACRAPSIASMVERMVEVALDYRRACTIGREAAKRMKSFTWTAAAMSFLTVVRDAVTRKGERHGDSNRG